MSRLFRIGARASPLSVTQALGVQAALGRALGSDEADFDHRLPFHPMTTTGDRIQDRRLQEAGGKGLFTKELDDALLAGRIDLAVHSMKDLPTTLPDGLVLACVPERKDVRDAFVSHTAKAMAELPAGALIGTASQRRQAQVLFARPDLRVATLRGNVETRLKKLEAGEAAATFLALAGLTRLGLEHVAASVLDPEDMPPAAGQGALAITVRADDHEMLEALAPLNQPDAAAEIAAERAFLAGLDGSCRTPIAAWAHCRAGVIRFLGEALAPDGSQRWRQQWRGPAAEAPAAAAALAAEIKRDAGSAILLDP
jgi:hydroxymethylbilane synthase